MITQEEIEELKLLEQISTQRQPSENRLTDEEASELAMLEEMTAPQEDPGFLSRAFETVKEGVVQAGSAIDSYSGAPTRAAIGAMMLGDNPASAFYNQFGEDPGQAPTGKELAQVAGFSDETQTIKRDPRAVEMDKKIFKVAGKPTPNIPGTVETFSPAGMAGLAVDIGADPLNFIPVGLVTKGAAKAGLKGIKGASKYALKGSVAGVEALADTNAISRSAETVSKYLDEVGKSVKSKFKPSQADDFQEFVSIAERNGIDPANLPETVEFGPHSTITKKAKVIAEGPAGEPVQQRWFQAQADIENAVDNNIKQYSGGTKLSKAEAGEVLREGYNKGVKQFFDQDMLTHSKVIQENPGIVLNQDALKNVTSKVKGLRNKAVGRTRRGFGGQRDEATSLLNDLSVFENSLDKAGNLSYKRASELLTNIGEEAFKKYPPGTKIPTDQKALRDLYFSLRDSMYETAGHVMGPEAATEMAMNNEIISNFLKEKGRIAKVFEGDLAPEKLFDRMAKSGDTNSLNALKEVLTPEDFQKFKGAYLDNFITRGKDGNPLYGMTRKKLVQNKDQISAILQPNEVQAFDELLRLGDRVGTHVFNTSNTNTASRFEIRKMAEEILSGGADELTLEKLKEIARNKAKPVQAEVIPGKTSTVNQKTAKTVLKQIPLLESKTRQALKGGGVAGIQQTNNDVESRKRAISGSK